MLWTLWRHMVVEVWRLVLLTTAVLVMVIAFAAAIKPLADGKLTALEFLRFFGFAIPPMLAYAVPFASGFGTTLAYHRMAQDNETLAAMAAGISRRRLLVPAFASGLVLTVGLMALNEQIIPRFLTRMERLISQDVTQILIRSIERGESVTIGSTEIYADGVQKVDPEPGSGVLDQFLLVGVAATDLDEEGGIESFLTARQAWVYIIPGIEAQFTDPDTAAAVIQFRDPVARLADGEVVVNDQLRTRPIAVPNPFQDDPKFLTWWELLELRDEPERMNWIDSRRMTLARAHASGKTVEDLRLRLRELGLVTLRGLRDEDVLIRAGSMRGSSPWTLTPRAGADRIEVEVYRRDGGVERFAARTATLTRASGPDVEDATAPSQSARLRFTLVLGGVRNLGSEAPTELEKLEFGSLEAPGDRLDGIAALRSAALLEEVGPERAGVESEAAWLEYDIDRLMKEITSKQHERLAMAVSCLVMVLTGAVTAMRLKEALPLVVYLWSFFPALGTLILISSGQQTIHKHGAAGIPLVWAGVALLSVYAFISFRSLSRH